MKRQAVRPEARPENLPRLQRADVALLDSKNHERPSEHDALAHDVHSDPDNVAIAGAGECSRLAPKLVDPDEDGRVRR